MSHATRPRRSALFIPADNARALQKITPSLAADCVIIDLEDAVSEQNKDPARAALPELLAQIDTGGRELLLRINTADSDQHALDLALLSTLPVDAVVLPKVEHAAQLQQLAETTPEKLQLWAMIETARGVLNAASICDASPRLTALMVGTQDLGLDLRLRANAQGADLIDHCLMQCLIAARAAGKLVMDAVCAEFKDLTLLNEQCRKAVNRGFDGKAAIHPAQLDTINLSFSPNAEQLEQAAAILQAWADSSTQGLSVANLNGSMIEELHVTQATLLLETAQAIKRYISTKNKPKNRVNKPH